MTGRTAPFILVLLVACLDPARQATCPVPPGQGPKLCTNGVQPAPDGTIDDFEDGDTQLSKIADRNGYWFASHDPNGSSIEPEPLVTSAGGAHGSQKAFHVHGQTASANGAWGSLVGANFVGEGVYDGSDHAGISFKAKVGSSTATKVVSFKVADVDTHPDGGVCKSCWNHFGKPIELTSEWHEYTVLFADMKQEAGWGDRYPAINPSKLIAMNWSFGPGRVFDLWIDDVQFVDCR
ncbi:MAG: carbohydrate binding domain-containing protein [Polyangiaceae bacterium]|jgi:hypothetical protein